MTTRQVIFETDNCEYFEEKKQHRNDRKVGHSFSNVSP